MKGKWKKIAVGGVSIGVAVALLATSLTSHKPVQAVDVFSDAKSLVLRKPTDTIASTFDIVELISKNSSFPTVNFVKNGEYMVFDSISGQVDIGTEELAYMVGGEEPFSTFWRDLSDASWMEPSFEKYYDVIAGAKNSFIRGLEDAGLLDVNDLTGYPLRMSVVENIIRPDQVDKILDHVYLDVMKYPSDPNNHELIGYFVAMDGKTGCYVLDGQEMKYVGARVARADATMLLNYQTGWNSRHIGDWDSEEDEDEEDDLESDDFFWNEDDYDFDDYDNELLDDPQQEIQQDESEYIFYIENEDESEERAIDFISPDEEYTQSTTVEYVPPIYQSGLTQEFNMLGGDIDESAEEILNETTEEITDEYILDALADQTRVMYNFYTVDEVISNENLIADKIEVYSDEVGDLRTFRYIILENNEWLKTQVFGLEESDKDNTKTIHVHSVTTMEVDAQEDEKTEVDTQEDEETEVDTQEDEETEVDTQEDEEIEVDTQEAENSIRYLKATNADSFQWIINADRNAFSDTVKLFYIAQLPENDISKNLRDDILNHVVRKNKEKRMACIVNDANLHSILGPDADADYPTLQNLISYLYQKDLAKVWDIKTADTTPVVGEMDRVNVDGEGVAHFVHKNVYAVDGSFVNPGVNLYDTITRGIDEGFDEVAYRIEQENFQREQESQIYNQAYDRIDGVTRALAIQFILTYTDSDMVFTKATIRVLELQPCYDFTYAPMEYIHPQVTVSGRGTEARISEFKQDFFGDANEPIDVEIIGMSTAEFCGKIEDLNVEYDMIYWGSNIGTFNKCADPKGNIYTVFNDYSMIGNAYTHIGDVNTHNISGRNNYGTIDNLLGTGSTRTQTISSKYVGWKTASGSKNLSNFYRTSGNDILATQIEKLKGFLEAGYPIVVSDKFFVNNVDSAKAYTVENISCSKTVLSASSDDPDVPGGLVLLSGYFEKANDKPPYADTGTIGDKHPEREIYGLLDTSSNIYQLVKWVTGEKEADDSAYSNFMTESYAKNDKDGKNNFNVALNRPKIQINMLSQPVDYTYSTKQVAGMDVIEAANYITPDDKGNNYLEYEFYISDATGSSSASKYTARLYVDANMDGKYVDTEEMTLSEVGDLDSGVMIAPSELRVGTHYLVRRELPQAYIGAVPWQLKIEDSVNKQIRSTKTGLCAVKEEKRDIYICQFLHQYKSQYTYLGENESPFGGNEKRAPEWTALLDNVPDFNVHIISVDATEYFGTNTSMSDEEYREKYRKADIVYNPAKRDYLPTEVFDPTLESYDMLLFGFTELFLADGDKGGNYCNTTNFGRLMKFIDSGKSVLFTHDTTFVYNSEGYVNAFSYNMRNPGGLDRYGITIGRSYYDGVPKELRDIYPSNLIRLSTNADGSFIEASSNQELKDKLFHNDVFEKYREQYGQKFDRDIAYKPGTDQKVMAPETIALTTSGWAHDFSSDFAYATFDYDGLGVYYKSTLTGSNARVHEKNKNYFTEETDAFKVGKVNSGAITEYPYKIDDILPIARTHGQYYQLDLETDNDGDGEGDTVVWFTLNNSIAEKSDPSTNILDSYNISPYDVRNNYYIYTKDNITYSGAGHSLVDQENEIKLFINTMIASYRVGTKAPIVKTVVNENILNDSTAASIPYDTDVKGVGVTQPIYFQIKDTNLIADTEKFVFYNAYVRVNSPEGAINIGTEKSPIYIKNITTEYNVTPKDYKDYVGARQVVNEQVYRMDVPLSLFEDMDVIEIYIKGESEVHKNNKVENKESNYVKYTISKVNLFDMD